MMIFGIGPQPRNELTSRWCQWGLTEVLRADPDGEVLLCILCEAHSFHDLLHRGVVAVL